MEGLIKTLDALPGFLIYLSLALSAFVENIFPPIPGDTITAFGAFLVGTGRLGFVGVYLSTTLGSLLGFLSLFWIGGYLGRHFFLERDYPFFKAKDILKAEGWFLRYGYFLVALNRFLPAVRSVISLAAGISRLSTARVAPMAFLSCAAWNLAWIIVGYTLGTHWDSVESKFSMIMKKYNLAVAIVCVLLFLLWFLRRKLRRRGKSP
jgi:membrane protein DedA with SNARE-associated domain